MHKKHLIPLWLNLDVRPIRTRCGIYLDNLDDMITNDTPDAQKCKRCVAYVESADRRRRLYCNRK